MLLVAVAMTERMAELDGGNKDFYQENLADFSQRWTAAISNWEQRATALRGKRVIAHHKSWVYLEAWLGLVQVATLEPVSGIPPTASHLGSLLDRLATRAPTISFVHPSRVINPLNGYRSAPAFRPFCCH